MESGWANAYPSHARTSTLVEITPHYNTTCESYTSISPRAENSSSQTPRSLGRFSRFARFDLRGSLRALGGLFRFQTVALR